MIINHNVTALNTHNKLSAASAAQSKSMEKLASGLRINKAGDDAAGLAISEKMRAQVRGLDQASRNAQDGISMIQTAEGALNETHDILQRMRELAVQSATDTNTSSDRSEIQKEMDQLSTEVTRISTNTEFNTKKLLNGQMGKTFSSSTNTLGPTDLKITGNDITNGTYTLTATAGGTDTTTVNTKTAASTLVAGDITAAAGTNYGDYSLAVTRGAGSTADVTLTGPDGKQTTASGVALNSDLAIGGITFDFDTHALDLAANTSGNINFSLTNAGLKVDLSGAKTVTTAAISSYAGESLNVGGLEFKMTWGQATTNDTTVLNVKDNAVKLQIGANADQNTTLSVNDMGAAALGVDALNVTSQVGANAAITSINKAIETVSSERSKLGATQNRLDHTINNLKTSSENLTAAESRVRDVDMAKEMMNQTKNSILAQAAQAMLAQSNQTPQGVLQLLR
ncbi:flagellin N-terminal helical domain-containing protein [Exiguobacterium sp. 9-2]|uniref:flagellin N-terminal helical domain-containing protein n=1 Tax=Exiguobacterium sp. 9-2 TaxID=3112419 RepID=UPI002E3102EC|nr:flagellin [Exiguobacterium sp. 9-2]